MKFLILFCFFCILIQELNTAEDFISFYHEIMPSVQTLPQILLHKEKIFSELLSRLHMKAKLSLEPILMSVGPAIYVAEFCCFLFPDKVCTFVLNFSLKHGFMVAASYRLIFLYFIKYIICLMFDCFPSFIRFYLFDALTAIL